MVCPKCNSNNVMTIDSRRHEQTTRRRKLCADCGERWSTLEVSMEEYKSLMKIKSSLYGTIETLKSEVSKYD